MEGKIRRENKSKKEQEGREKILIRNLIRKRRK